MIMEEKKLYFSKHELTCIKKAKSVIAADLTQHLSIEKLALHVGINSYKLKYGFRKLYGTSIYQFLLQSRIKQAKRLLRNQTLQVKVVAMQCGFKNVQHFITCFKKFENVTPGQFQKKQFKKFLKYK
jgi:AraC-like DNA-binding protein